MIEASEFPLLRLRRTEGLLRDLAVGPSRHLVRFRVVDDVRAPAPETSLG